MSSRFLDHDDSYDILSKDKSFIDLVKYLLTVDPESKVYVQDLTLKPNANPKYLTEVMWCTLKVPDNSTAVQAIRRFNPQYIGDRDSYRKGECFVSLYPGDLEVTDAFLLRLYFNIGERLWAK